MEEDNDGVYHLIEALQGIIDIDKEIISKFSQGIHILREIFTPAEISAIRDMICIDLDSTKVRLKELEDVICDGDSEMRALFNLEGK